MNEPNENGQEETGVPEVAPAETPAEVPATGDVPTDEPVTDESASQGLDDAVIVIHNPEQLQMMAALEGLKVECQSVFSEVMVESEVNESLARLHVEYGKLSCERAERWLDETGAIGWRCYIAGPGASDPKFQTVVGDKLRNRGWDGIEIALAG